LYLTGCSSRIPKEEQSSEAKIMSLKIIVVDDEPASLQLVRSLAAPMEHVVLPFEDYHAAGEKVETQRFDVVFAGMRMPDPAGLDLVRQVRMSEANREAAIVMLSTTDDIPSLRKAFGEGADFVLTKPVTAGRLRPMLAAMDSPGWKGRRHAARLPLFTEVSCTWDGRHSALRSMNISESGMLLQGSLDTAVGQEVAVEFKIAEVGATLKVPAKIARKEESERVGIGFIRLAPEDQNAIQLYVMGRLKDLTPQRDFSGIGMRRLFNP
jgi:CheY-like chemotaxis protein